MYGASLVAPVLLLFRFYDRAVALTNSLFAVAPAGTPATHLVGQSGDWGTGGRGCALWQSGGEPGNLDGYSTDNVLPAACHPVSCGKLSLPRLRARSKTEHSNEADNIYFKRWRGWPARLKKWRKLVLMGVAALVCLSIGYGIFLQFYLFSQLSASNRFPMIWRSVNVLSGVSPLLPQVLLLFGLYGWFWFNLAGSALLGDDRPRLPKEGHFPPESTNANLPKEERRPLIRIFRSWFNLADRALLRDDRARPPKEDHSSPERTTTISPEERRPLLRIFSREALHWPTERRAIPLGSRWWVMVFVCFALTAMVFRIALRGWGVRSLGEMRYGYVFWWLVTIVAMLLADTVQLLDAGCSRSRATYSSAIRTLHQAQFRTCS